MTTGLVFSGTIERPSRTTLTASCLEEGDLFVLDNEVDLPQGISVTTIRCAVCYYEEGDDDVRFVRPFEPQKDSLNHYDDLAYVSNNEPVRRIEITASGIKVI